MNLDILKENIREAIMQPCMENPWNKKSTKIAENGISEFGEYIMVKIRPDDSSWQCNITEDYVERILEMLPEKYRNKLVTLKHDGWTRCSYKPVFDTDTQLMWDSELRRYVSAKADYCDKYGCD